MPVWERCADDMQIAREMLTRYQFVNLFLSVVLRVRCDFRF